MMNLEKYGATRIPKFDRKEFGKFKAQHERYIRQLSSDSRIIEIGPGNGSFSIFLKESFGIHPSGFTLIDLSQTTVDLLKSQKVTEDFEIILSDVIEHLSTLPSDSVDLIVLRHVLEHMDRDYISRLVPILLNILKKDSQIIIEIPNFGNFPLGIWTCFGDFSHLTYFTHETISEAFLWNCNDKLEIRTLNVHPHFSPLNKGIASFLKEVYVYVMQWITIFLSRAFFWSDRFGTGKVSSPLMLVSIRKIG